MCALAESVCVWESELFQKSLFGTQKADIVLTLKSHLIRAREHIAVEATEGNAEKETERKKQRNVYDISLVMQARKICIVKKIVDGKTAKS